MKLWPVMLPRPLRQNKAYLSHSTFDVVAAAKPAVAPACDVGGETEATLIGRTAPPSLSSIFDKTTDIRDIVLTTATERGGHNVVPSTKYAAEVHRDCQL